MPLPRRGVLPFEREGWSWVGGEPAGGGAGAGTGAVPAEADPGGGNGMGVRRERVSPRFSASAFMMGGVEQPEV